ncbi:MAG: polyphenol oxidase family protein [Solirubrobacteraceae bacterium]
MRLPEPFYHAGEHVGIDLPGARAVFTTRRGGFSTGRYASLNLGHPGAFTDDRPNALRRNRESLEEALAVRFASAQQVHGVKVATADWRSQPCEADGLATAVPGLAPMVLSADCLPIALAGQGAVAMLHAGWRGLVAGVVREGVGALRGLGAGGPFAAAIGPGAGPCCYEVGEEVRAAFSSCSGALAGGRRLDLKAAARETLALAGVTCVYDVGLCTICSDPSLFFSHRRDGGVTGRQAGIAWRR